MQNLPIFFQALLELPSTHPKQKMTGISYQTSVKHRDISTARQTRDVCDTRALITYLIEIHFLRMTLFFTIANGMTAL